MMEEKIFTPAQTELLQQAVSYFKKYPVYAKLFWLMKQKYASLGHLGGSFPLGALSAEEREALLGFTGIDPEKDGAVRLPYARLVRALEKSKFGALTWEAILEQYYGLPLSIKKETQLRQQEAKEAFWKSCLSECRNEDVKSWLSEILLERKNGCRLLEKQYKTDASGLRLLLKTLDSALGRLPIYSGQRLLLPVFATQITGNPHYFDDGSAACSLLLHYGACRFGEADTSLSAIEQRESLLYQMGLLKDGLSNTCLAFGLIGRKRDGQLHEGLCGFSMEKQALPITLQTLGSLSQLLAAEDCRLGNDRQPLPDKAPQAVPGNAPIIYILENPAAFSYLTEKYPAHAFLCTSGQLTLACYAAMDLFPESYTFYYAGDFDPEGLQIAQGLKKRYGSRLVLWNYQKKLYLQAMSDIALSPARLNKLEKIEIPELLEIRQCLLTHKRPAYQEGMLENYLCPVNHP